MRTTLLAGAIVTLALSAQAQVNKTETRTGYTGKDQVVSVGARCSAARESSYSTELYSQLSSEFSMTRCREKMTFQVNVETTGKWYRWSKEVTAIPGTEIIEYELVTETKTSTRTFGEDGYDYFDRSSLERQCNELRKAYADQVIPVTASNCVNPQDATVE